jgi:maleate isomerase
MHAQRNWSVTRISLDRPSQQQFDSDAMLAAARLLADARVHAICWNGTSGAWKGAASDRSICEAIQRETGIPATSATLAQLEAFRAYGITRYGLAVPYRDDVRQAIIRVYAEEGLECVSSAHLGISVNFDFAHISADGLLLALWHPLRLIGWHKPIAGWGRLLGECL